MIRFLVVPLILILSAAPTRSQENQLDNNQALFAVLAARSAAGYDSPGAPSAAPIRVAILNSITQSRPPSLENLGKFFAAHKLNDPSADLSQYISFALSIGNPPEFRYRYPPNELAPEVAQLAGFEKLIAQFWREASLDSLWKTSQQPYEEALGLYHLPITKALLEANAYLRNPTSGYLGRRFQVYVDLMGPPGLIQSRSLKDDYFVVVTPAGQTPEVLRAGIDDQTRQVRHAYLHYVIDPLTIKYAAQIMTKESLQDISDGAPALEEPYKKDFLLLAAESLIRGVEARLAPLAEREKLVNSALRDGFVLTPFFAEQLPVYEKQPESLRIYLPDMIDAINLRKESRRLDGVQFAPAKLAPRSEPARSAKPLLTPAQNALMEGESLSFDKQYAKAKQAFNRVLEQPDDGALHARAYFGLGRIAAFEKDPELAEKLFQKTLEVKPDADTESWANLYLGRLAAASGDNDQALAHYKAALAVNGGSSKARAEAERALTTPAPTQP